MALGPQEMEDPATGRRPSTCAIRSSSKALLESCEIVRERTFMIHTAREVAQYLGVELEGDPAAPISGVASPERASQEDLIYVDSWRHLGRAASSCHPLRRSAAGRPGGCACRDSDRVRRLRLRFW